MGISIMGIKNDHLNYASETTYAIAGPGGRTRLASGPPISNPAGTSWKVSLGSDNRISEFNSDGSAGRFNNGTSWWDWSGPSSDGPKGRWKRGRDVLEINWPEAYFYYSYHNREMQPREIRIAYIAAA